MDLVFSTQKLSMGTGTVNHLTEAHTVITSSSARPKIPLKLTETIPLLTAEKLFEFETDSDGSFPCDVVSDALGRGGDESEVG